MPQASIDPSTGSLVIAEKRIFPLILSDAPPKGGKTPEGKDAWGEIANDGLGANFIRSGQTLRAPWNLPQLDAQIAEERARMDAAQSHGLHCLLRLVNAAEVPAGAGSEAELILSKLVNAFKGHPALGAYKGADEPAHGNTLPDRLVRAYQKLKVIDPHHPVLVTQAPIRLEELAPYQPAFDVTGADIYPISYGQQHSDLSNREISVVGDVTKKMVVAGGGKPVWMTLQIAWSGVLPTQEHPTRVPRFPSAQELRFMAYQAIVNGARGLAFFGGEYTQLMRPRDATSAWNWTYWQMVLRPLLIELNSPTVQPALTAALLHPGVVAAAADVELTTRRSGNTLYAIAVRRSARTTSQVTFTGLPSKDNGSQLNVGDVAFEYAQDPPSPPVLPGNQKFRRVNVSNGSFTDWLGPYDVRVYRFQL